MLARRFLPQERADRVADGWGGDRLRALARGGEMTLVWMTAWDTPAEAVEFVEAVPELIADAHLERRDDRVLVVIARSAAVSLADRVSARTRLVRPTGLPGTPPSG